MKEAERVGENVSHPIDDIMRRLEPASIVDYARRNLHLSEVASLSSAISLRRIADALCRWGDGDEADVKEEGK